MPRKSEMEKLVEAVAKRQIKAMKGSALIQQGGARRAPKRKMGGAYVRASKGGAHSGGARRRMPKKRGGIPIDMGRAISGRKNPTRVMSARRAAVDNPWLEYVAEYRKMNPGVSYKDALSEAHQTYVPIRMR